MKNAFLNCILEQKCKSCWDFLYLTATSIACSFYDPLINTIVSYDFLPIHFDGNFKIT